VNTDQVFKFGANNHEPTSGNSRIASLSSMKHITAILMRNLPKICPSKDTTLDIYK